jgi:hypothetical protein
MLWSLNGHCSVIVSLNAYLQRNDDVEIREAVMRGIQAVEDHLPLFDVPLDKGGSKVKLYGSGLFRLRWSGGSNDTSPPIESFTLRFPNDPPLRIFLGEIREQNTPGCTLFQTESSKFDPPEYIYGRHSRKLGRIKNSCQGIMRLAMTDNYWPGDKFTIELAYYDNSRKPIIIDYYSSRARGYVEIGKMGGSASKKWQHQEIALPINILDEPFGNIVPGDHGYHKMNYEYLFKLHTIRPSEKIIQTAQEWQSRH